MEIINVLLVNFGTIMVETDKGLIEIKLDAKRAKVHVYDNSECKLSTEELTEIYTAVYEELRKQSVDIFTFYTEFKEVEKELKKDINKLNKKYKFLGIDFKSPELESIKRKIEVVNRLHAMLAISEILNPKFVRALEKACNFILSFNLPKNNNYYYLESNLTKMDFRDFGRVEKRDNLSIFERCMKIAKELAGVEDV